MGTTIRDIANAANVSIGTVSRALKNQPGLSEGTRRRIADVARRLGYDVQNLRNGRLRRLAFVLHRQHNNFLASPFFSQILHGVEASCRANGIVPSVLALGPTDDVAAQIRLHAPDAIAVAGFVERETLSVLQAMRCPLVLIDAWAPDSRSINVDNAGGAALATRHLFAIGRRRVAFLAGSLAHYSIAQRAIGYRRAWFEAGLLFDPALEISLPAVDDLAGAAAQAMSDLLSSGSRPDAVFAYNDVSALAAMGVCRARGLRVPEDIAFVGFDDIASAAVATPSLTTISVDKDALGRLGIALLLDEAPSSVELTLPVHLVQRASTTLTHRT
jgi:DNA-binding LacI/PurR family transcriptional regulator